MFIALNIFYRFQYIIHVILYNFTNVKHKIYFIQTDFTKVPPNNRVWRKIENLRKKVNSTNDET